MQTSNHTVFTVILMTGTNLAAAESARKHFQTERVARNCARRSVTLRGTYRSAYVFGGPGASNPLNELIDQYHSAAQRRFHTAVREGRVS